MLMTVGDWLELMFICSTYLLLQRILDPLKTSDSCLSNNIYCTCLFQLMGKLL